MAQIRTLVGHQLRVLIGNGASPEVFSENCLINSSRGIQFDTDQQEFTVPDCDDPTLPAWRQLFKDNNRAQIEGAGLLHTVSTKFWNDYLRLEPGKNVQLMLWAVTHALGGGYWQGSFKCTSFNIQGQSRKDLVQANIVLMSDGEVIWFDNP